MPCIAVLIPTYKPDWYLERCLDSLEAQTLTMDKFKVYIALNGSDGSYQDFILDLLKKYNFNYEYIYLDVAGVSYARNFLLERSCEDYIAFVDDDDVLSSDYLEQLLIKASAEFIAVSNVFNFKETLFNLSENYIGKSFSSLSETERSLFKSRKFFSSSVCKLIHRDIIGNVRFNPKLDIGEDSLFMAAISKRVKGIRKAKSTACYYVYEREGSASRKQLVYTEELSRAAYLIFIYVSMFFKGYNALFLLSRVAASLVRLKRLF